MENCFYLKISFPRAEILFKIVPKTVLTEVVVIISINYASRSEVLSVFFFKRWTMSFH